MLIVSREVLSVLSRECVAQRPRFRLYSDFPESLELNADQIGRDTDTLIDRARGYGLSKTSAAARDLTAFGKAIAHHAAKSAANQPIAVGAGVAIAGFGPLAGVDLVGAGLYHKYPAGKTYHRTPDPLDSSVDEAGVGRCAQARAALKRASRER